MTVRAGLTVLYYIVKSTKSHKFAQIRATSYHFGIFKLFIQLVWQNCFREKKTINWPITHNNYDGHISCTIGTKYRHLVPNLPFIIPTKKQFIVPPNFRGEYILNFRKMGNKYCPWQPCLCRIGMECGNLIEDLP